MKQITLLKSPKGASLTKFHETLDISEGRRWELMTKVGANIKALEEGANGTEVLQAYIAPAETEEELVFLSVNAGAFIQTQGMGLSRAQYDKQEVTSETEA